MRITPGGSAAGHGQMTVNQPKRWDFARPDMYVAVTTIELAGHPADRGEKPFVIRTAVFMPDQAPADVC